MLSRGGLVSSYISSSLKCFSSSTSNVLKVGDILSHTRIFTSEDVLEYSKVSHDSNPLHFDSALARRAGFDDRLVHGMLVASMFPHVISSHFVSLDSLHFLHTELCEDWKMALTLVWELLMYVDDCSQEPSMCHKAWILSYQSTSERRSWFGLKQSTWEKLRRDTCNKLVLGKSLPSHLNFKLSFHWVGYLLNVFQGEIPNEMLEEWRRACSGWWGKSHLTFWFLFHRWLDDDRLHLDRFLVLWSKG